MLLSARRVGPTGFAYGLDMTDEMLALAARTRPSRAPSNVEFLKGHIEEIPLPDNTVDVIISNCVINLSADKGRVIREAFRVLKPGGRFAVSDVVAQGSLPADLRADMEAWVGCIAGALEEGEYRRAAHGGRLRRRRLRGDSRLRRAPARRQEQGRVGRVGLRSLRCVGRPDGERVRAGA